MLKVTVLFFASYREQAKTTATMVEVPEGSNLARVIDVVCESYPDIKCPSQNIVAAIYNFLPYLTNDDLDEMKKTLHTLKDHRNQKEYLAKLETLKHSWPYPDTKQQIEND